MLAKKLSTRYHLYLYAAAILRERIENNTLSISITCGQCNRQRDLKRSDYSKVTVYPTGDATTIHIQPRRIVRSEPDDVLFYRKPCEMCTLVSLARPFFAWRRFFTHVWRQYTIRRQRVYKHWWRFVNKSTIDKHTVEQVMRWKTGEELVYLKVPFDEKEIAKRCGARWDFKVKRWHIPVQNAYNCLAWIHRDHQIIMRYEYDDWPDGDCRPCAFCHKWFPEDILYKRKSRDKYRYEYACKSCKGACPVCGVWVPRENLQCYGACYKCNQCPAKRIKKG